MLLVKTRIGPSTINGTGLFADQFIPQGSVIWKFTPGFDLRVTPEELKPLSEPARESFLKHCYVSRRSTHYVLCFDNARFFNHSDHPNVLDSDSPESEEGIDIAARDIYPGEELTCNYQDFDLAYIGPDTPFPETALRVES